MATSPKSKPASLQAVQREAPIPISCVCSVASCYDTKLKPKIIARMETSVKDGFKWVKTLALLNDPSQGYKVELIVTKLERDDKKSPPRLACTVTTKVTPRGKPGAPFSALWNGNFDCKDAKNVDMDAIVLAAAVTSSVLQHKAIDHILNRKD